MNLLSSKYCIIIPHRNLLSYLNRCVNSIPIEDYIHILIIDNSDVPLQFENIESLEQKKDSITIIYCEPRNIGYVRNQGIEYLIEQNFTGYIVFADSDDYFTAYSKSIFDQYYNSNVDIIYLGIEGRDDISGELSNNADYVISVLKRVSLDNYDELKFNCGPCWGRIYDFNFIKNNYIRFADAICCEDTYFSAMCGYYEKNILININLPFYVYVQRSGSIVNSALPNKLRDAFAVNYKLILWLKEKKNYIGMFYVKANLIYFWIAWGQYDFRALKYFFICMKILSIKQFSSAVYTILKRRIKRLSIHFSSN